MTSPSFTLDRRRAVGLAVALILSPRSFAIAQTDPDAPYDGLLKRYVKPSADGVTRVDYAAWRANAADRAALDSYILEMAQRRPSAMARGDAMVYWGNLYNAITLKVIIDRYPVASIRDIKSDSWLDPKAYSGPWRQPRVTVEGVGCRSTISSMPSCARPSRTLASITSSIALPMAVPI